jgi:putative modified peptide
MATHSPQDLDLLLSKLSGDDGFRMSFLNDPQMALGTLGIQLDAASIPSLRSLPSKEVIAASRHAIKGKLENAAGAIPFFLSGQR